MTDLKPNLDNFHLPKLSDREKKHIYTKIHRSIRTNNFSIQDIINEIFTNLKNDNTYFKLYFTSIVCLCFNNPKKVDVIMNQLIQNISKPFNNFLNQHNFEHNQSINKQHDVVKIKEILNSNSESLHVSQYIQENIIFNSIQTFQSNKTENEIIKLINHINTQPINEDEKKTIQFLLNILNNQSINNISGSADQVANADLVHFSNSDNGIIIELKKDHSCLDSELGKKLLLKKINTYHKILNFLYDFQNYSTKLLKKEDLIKITKIINQIIRAFNSSIFTQKTYLSCYHEDVKNILDKSPHYIAYYDNKEFYIANYFLVGLFSKDVFTPYKYSFNIREDITFNHNLYEYLNNLLSFSYLIDYDTFFIMEKDTKNGSPGGRHNTPEMQKLNIFFKEKNPSDFEENQQQLTPDIDENSSLKETKTKEKNEDEEPLESFKAHNHNLNIDSVNHNLVLNAKANSVIENLKKNIEKEKKKSINATNNGITQKP